jgi:hypothetical protein
VLSTTSVDSASTIPDRGSDLLPHTGFSRERSGALAAASRRGWAQGRPVVRGDQRKLLIAQHPGQLPVGRRLWVLPAGLSSQESAGGT